MRDTRSGLPETGLEPEWRPKVIAQRHVQVSTDHCSLDETRHTREWDRPSHFSTHPCRREWRSKLVRFTRL